MANRTFAEQRAFTAAREGRKLKEPSGVSFTGRNDKTARRAQANHRKGTVEGAARRRYDQARKGG